MLKMGTFGILHYCLPMFPVAARQCAPWIAVLAIIGIIYGALVAMVQPNMKKLVAYSSVSHLGFVVLGIFSFTQMGLDGAVYQMLNHGISTGALFAIVGLLYERRHSLEIEDYGGVATVAPWLSTIFLVTTLASIGLPTLNNFVGEFLVLQGTAIANFTWATYAAIGVILSACYMLWLYQRVFFGETGETVRHHMFDLKPREWAAVVPLVAMMIWMGVYSQSFLPPIGQTTARVLEQTQVNRAISGDDSIPISRNRVRQGIQCYQNSAYGRRPAPIGLTTVRVIFPQKRKPTRSRNWSGATHSGAAQSSPSQFGGCPCPLASVSAQRTRSASCRRLFCPSARRC